MIKRIMLYKLIILISLMANVVYLKGQDTETKSISVDKYDQLKEEVTLKKTKRIIKFPEPKSEEEEDDETLNKNRNSWNPGLGMFGGIFKLLAYALIAILLGLILFIIFNNIELDKKAIEKEILEEKEIEDISEIDADGEYEAALKAGNYRLALRMKFIKILQILSEAKKIEWKNEKTNRHYLRELSSSEYHNPFRKTATIFEYYWYGNNALDVQQFEECNKDFDSFLIELER